MTSVLHSLQVLTSTSLLVHDKTKEMQRNKQAQRLFPQHHQQQQCPTSTATTTDSAQGINQRLYAVEVPVCLCSNVGALHNTAIPVQGATPMQQQRHAMPQVSVPHRH